MRRNLQEESRQRSAKSLYKYTKELKRKGKKYNRFKLNSSDKVGNAIVVHAPERISIYSFDDSRSNAYLDTMGFIDEICKFVGVTNVILDFTQTKSIKAAAMVVLYSHVQQNLVPDRYKTTVGWSRTSPQVNSMLRRSGVVRLISSGRTFSDFSNLKSLPVVSGVGGSNLDEIIDFIQERIYDNKMDPDTEYKFGDAVSETINNVGLHAYPNLTSDEKEWWLTCDLIGDQLYLAIYDNGVGIPNTVVKKKWFLASLKSSYPEKYKEIVKTLGDTAKDYMLYAFKRLKDAELIYISMIGDVTGTKKSKHGQGSKSIKALVSDTKDGKLWVYSNKGLYKFEPGDKTPQVYRLPTKMNGTLIQWNIQI
jgi:hypothetical protein